MEGIEIYFGQGHDSKYGQATIDQTPENGVSIMDRALHLKKEFINDSKKKTDILF